MVLGTDGKFYGTTRGAGAYGNYGTVFRITPTGTLTTLYSFYGSVKLKTVPYPLAPPPYVVP